MIKRYGSHGFVGMKSAVAEHLLEDQELAFASRVDYSEIGAIATEGGASKEIALSVANGVRGGGVVESDGTLIYRYDQVVVHNETASYVPDNTNDMICCPVGERVYMADSSQNMVFDNVPDGYKTFRQHGALLPTDPTYNIDVFAQDNQADIIVDITQDNPALVDCGVDEHGLVTGDGIYINALSGMDELEGRWFRVTRESSTEFSLDGEDTTDTEFDFSDASVVAWHANGRGTGVYRYAVSYRIEMPSGDIIESSLQQITRGGREDIDFEELGLTAGSLGSRIKLSAPGLTTDEIVAYCPQAGSLGHLIDSDIIVSARFWRTKESGTTYYLIREVTSIDDESKITCWDDMPDTALGAAWVEDRDAHDLPPVSSLIAHAGNRIYCNDISNTRNLRFSQMWGPDYFSPTDYIEMPAVITALGAYGDSVIVFSNSRMWRYVNTDGVGFLDEIDAPEGCANPYSVITTPYGLLYAGARGLYAYSGTTPERISDDIQDLVLDEVGPWHAAWVDNKGYFFSGGTAVFKVHFIGGKPRWSRETSIGDFMFGRKGDDSPYYMKSDGIYKLHGTTAGSLRVDTKLWGDGRPVRPLWVYMDMDATEASVTLINEAADTNVVATNQATTNRELVRYSVDDSFIGKYFKVRVDGNVTIYGIALEVY